MTEGMGLVLHRGKLYGKLVTTETPTSKSGQEASARWTNSEMSEDSTKLKLDLGISPYGYRVFYMRPTLAVVRIGCARTT
jgi:hypothetical protein